MYTQGFDDLDSHLEKDKFLLLYKNGDPITKPIQVKIQKNMKLSYIHQIIEDQLYQRKIKTLRLFNATGIEIVEDDLNYVKDGQALYASKGEEFDSNSTFSEYELQKQLGEGGFGKVYLGVHKHTKEKVAIKITQSNILAGATDMDYVFREGEILKSLNHPNIVKIWHCYTLSNMQVVFIMEYLEGGSLIDRLEKQPETRFSEAQTKNYFRQMCKAMAYCHQNNLIHRDLKLENILFTKQDGEEIKIVDFGVAGVASNVQQDDSDQGTELYMAPEIISGKIKIPTPSVDIWAMGVTLFAMLTGRQPFAAKTKKESFEKILSGAYEIPKEVLVNLSKDCIDVISKCLNLDHNTRIRADELMHHPWIEDKTIEKLMKQQSLEEKKSSGLHEEMKAKSSNLSNSNSSQMGNNMHLNFNLKLDLNKADLNQKGQNKQASNTGSNYNKKSGKTQPPGFSFDKFEKTAPNKFTKDQHVSKFSSSLATKKK